MQSSCTEAGRRRGRSSAAGGGAGAHLRLCASRSGHPRVPRAVPAPGPRLPQAGAAAVRSAAPPRTPRPPPRRRGPWRMQPRSAGTRASLVHADRCARSGGARLAARCARNNCIPRAAGGNPMLIAIKSAVAGQCSKCLCACMGCSRLPEECRLFASDGCDISICNQRNVSRPIGLAGRRPARVCWPPAHRCACVACCCPRGCCDSVGLSCPHAAGQPNLTAGTAAAHCRSTAACQHACLLPHSPAAAHTCLAHKRLLPPGAFPRV